MIEEFKVSGSNNGFSALAMLGPSGQELAVFRLWGKSKFSYNIVSQVPERIDNTYLNKNESGIGYAWLSISPLLNEEHFSTHKTIKCHYKVVRRRDRYTSLQKSAIYNCLVFR